MSNRSHNLVAASRQKPQQNAANFMLPKQDGGALPRRRYATTWQEADSRADFPGPMASGRSNKTGRINTAAEQGAPPATEPQPVAIPVNETRQVSGLFQASAATRACYVLAHGAGAGMKHPFLTSVANGLAQRGIATLRYQFPYMEQGSKRPDSPALAQATVRAAVIKAAELAPDIPLFAGGKSFGGRMSSQAQAVSPLPGVHGLVFLGFPLHPPGRPSIDRAKHLFDVQVPMLFLQGTRDEFAHLDLLEPLVKQLGNQATLQLFEQADHSFHVPARTGRTDAEILAELLDTVASWIDRVISSTGKPPPN